SELPARVLTKARRLPSGDHTGLRFWPGGLRIALVPLPSGLATQMAAPPVITRVKAMRLPSGDHTGPNSSSLVEARAASPPPPASTTYTSLVRCPLACRVKAMRLPSGDQAGSKSLPGF